MVDESGSVIIMENNTPRHIIVEFGQAEELSLVSDADVAEVSARLIEKNRKAYEELAK